MHSWSRLAVVRSAWEAECWWAPHCHSSFMHRQMESEGSIEHTWQNRKGGVDGKRRPHSTCLTGICLSHPGTRSRWEGYFSRCSMLKEAGLKLHQNPLSDLPILYSLIMFILNLMEGCLWMVYRYDIDKQKRMFSFPYREVKSWFGSVVLVSFPSFPIFCLLDLILSEWEFVEDSLVFTRTAIPTAYQTERVSRATYSHCEFFSGCFAGNTCDTYANTIKVLFGLFHQDGQC